MDGEEDDDELALTPSHWLHTSRTGPPSTPSPAKPLFVIFLS